MNTDNNEFFVSRQDLDDTPSEEEEAIAAWREHCHASKGKTLHREPSHTEPPRALTVADLEAASEATRKAMQEMQEMFARAQKGHREEMQKLHDSVRGLGNQMRDIGNQIRSQSDPMRLELEKRLRTMAAQRNRMAHRSHN